MFYPGMMPRNTPSSQLRKVRASLQHRVCSTIVFVSELLVRVDTVQPLRCPAEQLPCERFHHTTATGRHDAGTRAGKHIWTDNRRIFFWECFVPGRKKGAFFLGAREREMIRRSTINFMLLLVQSIQINSG